MHETPDFFDKLPFDILLFQEILRDDVFTQKICFDKKKKKRASREGGMCLAKKKSWNSKAWKIEDISRR